jgi:hypothetical protein
MCRPSWIQSLAVAFLLICCDVASASVAMLLATQDGAPARLVQTTHGYPNLLKAARLKNFSDKPIVSYTIGWGYVRPKGIEYHAGVPMKVLDAIKPGVVYKVLDQAVAFDSQAEDVIFFVAAVTFADGSRWKANLKEVERTSGLKMSQ